MARSIAEINSELKKSFVQDTRLRSAFGLEWTEGSEPEDYAAWYDSKMSAANVVSVLMYITAACASAVEHIMDWWREDLDVMIKSERYGHSQWYADMAKRFQYGYELNDDGGYDVEDENAQIVKRAVCIPDNGIGVTIKVATEDGGALAPITGDHLEALYQYMCRVKPAGIPVHVISGTGDQLKIKLVVYYDPVVYAQDDVQVVVKNLVNGYLQDIEFNGTFTTTAMVDWMQKDTALHTVEVTDAKARYGGYAYATIEHNAVYVPHYGYMTLDEDELEVEAVAIR